jgi:hypothetical protein
MPNRGRWANDLSHCRSRTGASREEDASLRWNVVQPKQTPRETVPKLAIGWVWSPRDLRAARRCGTMREDRIRLRRIQRRAQPWRDLGSLTCRRELSSNRELRPPPGRPVLTAYGLKKMRTQQQLVVLSQMLALCREPFLVPFGLPDVPLRQSPCSSRALAGASGCSSAESPCSFCGTTAPFVGAMKWIRSQPRGWTKTLAD